MRTLSADLTAAQKASVLNPKYKVVFSGPASGTYEQDLILLIDHFEEWWSQRATIVLDNRDGSITTDFHGAKVVITYGLEPPYSSNTSDAAPLWVEDQTYNMVAKTVTITAKGLPDLLAEDRASAAHVQETADLKTIKDLITEVVKGTLDTRLNSAAYSVGDIVIPITPNGFVFRVTAVAGDATTGSSPPTWDLDIGDTTTDNNVTWKNIGKELTVFSHTKKYTVDFDSEDDLLDSFNPADLFTLGLNDTKLYALEQLLQYTKCVARFEQDGDVHILVPTVDGPKWAASTAYTVNDYVTPTTGVDTRFALKCTTAGTSHTSEPDWANDLTNAGDTVKDPSPGGPLTWTAVAHDATYEWNAPGEHKVFENAHRKRLIQPNYVVVKSPEGSDDSYSGSAEETDSSDKTDMEKRVFFDMRVGSNAEATSIATAFLQELQLRAQVGTFSAPMNVGQEVYDYVRVTDGRLSPGGTDDVRVGSVGGIQRMAGQGQFFMRVALGDHGEGGFIGLDIPVEEAPPPPPLHLHSAASDGEDGDESKAMEAVGFLAERVAAVESKASRHGTKIAQNNRAVSRNFRDVNVLKLRVLDFKVDTRELNHVTVSANYTIKDEDEIIGVDTDVAAVTLTLPSAAAAAEGRPYSIQDEGNNADVNNITIVTEGSELINEQNSYVVNSRNGGVGLYSDKTDWWARSGSGHFLAYKPTVEVDPAKVPVTTATESNPTVGTAVA